MLSLTPGKMTREVPSKAGRSRAQSGGSHGKHTRVGHAEPSSAAKGWASISVPVKQNTCRCPEAELPVESGDAAAALVQPSLTSTLFCADPFHGPHRVGLPC